jgi:hypothetical protein
MPVPPDAAFAKVAYEVKSNTARRNPCRYGSPAMTVVFLLTKVERCSGLMSREVDSHSRGGQSGDFRHRIVILQSVNITSRYSRSGRCMVTKCANSACGTPFLRLRTGRLFLVDTLRTRAQANAGTAAVTTWCPEYFWLCGECSLTMEVTVDQDGSVVIAPRRLSPSLPDLLANESGMLRRAIPDEQPITKHPRLPW